MLVCMFISINNTITHQWRINDKEMSSKEKKNNNKSIIKQLVGVYNNKKREHLITGVQYNKKQGWETK